MATLLGPVGRGMAGHQGGMDLYDGPPGRQATNAEQGVHRQMDGNDCAEHDSGESHRCAGLWSTACCDYFASGAKINIEPSFESSSRASDALPIGTVAEVLEPAALWGHLMLPIAGRGRAGPSALVILHSSLLL